MDIQQFEAGHFLQQTAYRSFSPAFINHPWVISTPEINKLLSEANRSVGELNAFSQLVPNVDFFISMHIVKEATTSSRIEGTKTNMEEALVKEEDIEPERRDDWAEVRNYVEAMNMSIKSLDQLPISNRLLKQTHRTLLSGVRGKHKLPGEYRRSQNWIGATLKDAVFVPPHHTEIDELMSDLEKFVHEESLNVPHLVKIAIIHYQFETIHPFLDGNGRLGRLLITLYLVSHQVLSRPTLYLSDFFEKNRTYYYDNLMAARLKNDLTQWIKFFLVGVTETARSSIKVFQKVIALKQKIDTEILPQLGSRERIANGFTLISHLYQSPVIDTREVSQVLGVATSTANRLVKDLVALGVLRELTGYRRNRKFIFEEYFAIFQ